MLPNGLIELTQRIIKEIPINPQRIEKADTEELWRELANTIFLDNNRNSAEVIFIAETLSKSGLLDREYILNNTCNEWEEKTREFLLEKTKSLSGRKEGILQGLLSNLSIPSHSLKESAIFFKKRNISPEYLKEINQEPKEIGEFLKIAYNKSSSYITGRKNPEKLFNIGLTKALLWLQAFDLAEDYCPPSRQIKDFVDYNLDKKNWKQIKSSTIENLNEDFRYISSIRKFNKDEIKPQIPESTTRDVGIAIWYWKSTQNLLKGKIKKELTPKRLLNYLDVNGMYLIDLGDKLGDIEQIDNLAKDIGDFLED